MRRISWAAALAVAVVFGWAAQAQAYVYWGSTGTTIPTSPTTRKPRPLRVDLLRRGPDRRR